MVGRSAGGKSSGRARHNRPGDWIWGRRVVLETLRSGRWPIRDLWLCESVESEVSGEVYRLAEGLGIEVQLGDSESIRARRPPAQHRGVLARAGEFPFRAVAPAFGEARGGAGGGPAGRACELQESRQSWLLRNRQTERSLCWNGQGQRIDGRG